MFIFLQLHRYFAQYIYIYMYIIIKYIYNHMHIYIYIYAYNQLYNYIHTYHHPLNMHIPQPGPSSLPWGDADPIFADREAEHSIMLGVLGNLQKVTRQRVFRHLATWITDDFWCFFFDWIAHHSISFVGSDCFIIRGFSLSELVSVRSFKEAPP